MSKIVSEIVSAARNTDSEPRNPVLEAASAFLREMDENCHGSVRAELHKALVNAKFAAKGIDPASDAWNQTSIPQTDEAFAPYAAALRDAIENHFPRDKPPAHVQAALDAFMAVAPRADAATPSV